MELETLIKITVEKSYLLINKIANISRSRKIVTFLVLSVFAIIFGLSASGVRFAYKVNYGGEVIATVKDKSQFDAAIKIVKERVNSFGKEVEAAVQTPEYKAAVVLSSVIDSDSAVADAIIENTEEIVEGYEIRIDGKATACVQEADIINYIESRKKSFAIEGTHSVCEYVNDIEVVKGYYVSSNFDTKEYAKAIVNDLSVRAVGTIVTDIEIENETITQSSNEMLRGDSAVLEAGKNGVRRIIETITSINGVEGERITLSDITISEPVNRVILIGTAKSVATAEQRLIAHNSGFIFPLPNGNYKISSYYGDGRNHKGVDLCAPNGTSIFAVASGTVISSGWQSGYGYCVDIDHGNGTVTKYAHASVLCVSKGETVIAGQVIAKVGSTGNSNGNHLHFEVKVDGKNVDPAPYLNLD